MTGVVRKTALFEPFIYKNALFYQDRLGTNIGKVLKKGPFSAGALEAGDHWLTPKL